MFKRVEAESEACDKFHKNLDNVLDFNSYRAKKKEGRVLGQEKYHLFFGESMINLVVKSYFENDKAGAIKEIENLREYLNLF